MSTDLIDRVRRLVTEGRMSRAGLARAAGLHPNSLRDITLPVISPAILSGWLLAFTISLDDVVITSFTNGPGYNTLPMLVWAKVRLGVTPDINALGSLIVAVVAAGVTVSSIVITRAERRRQRDITAALAEGTCPAMPPCPATLPAVCPVPFDRQKKGS